MTVLPKLAVVADAEPRAYMGWVKASEKQPGPCTAAVAYRGTFRARDGRHYRLEPGDRCS